MQLSLKVFVLSEYAYFRTGSLSSSIDPESALRLITKLAANDHTTWNYRKDGSDVVVFFKKKTYRLKIKGRYLRMPRRFFINWLPPVIINHILFSSGMVHIRVPNKLIQVDTLPELEDCQRN